MLLMEGSYSLCMYVPRVLLKNIMFPSTRTQMSTILGYFSWYIYTQNRALDYYYYSVWYPYSDVVAKWHLRAMLTLA